MRTTTWTCDRCGSTAITSESDAINTEGDANVDPGAPLGWREYWQDGELDAIDVCPNCVTDEERANDLLTGITTRAARQRRTG